MKTVLQEYEAITKARYISGFPTSNNLDKWASYSKQNSYHPDRQQLRHDIGTEGAGRDLAQGSPDVPRQKDTTQTKGWRHYSDVGKRCSSTGPNGTRRPDKD
jgi:hypothetical protein